MQCSRCQHQNPPHGKFCLECGTPLRPANESGLPAASYTDLEHGLSEALGQQTATAQILRVISRSQTDVQPVFDTIADNAVSLFRPWSVAVYRYDGECMHVAAVRGGLPGSEEYLRGQGPRRPTRNFMAGRCIIECSVVHIPDFETADVPTAARDIALLRGFKATLTVPMLKEGQPIGVISVSRSEAGAFSQAEIDLLQTFADQAVIAIENVRLFTELQEKNHALTAAHAQVTNALEQQTATSEILQVISQSPTETQPVFETIVRNAVRLCGADDGGVYRFDGQLVHSVAHDGLTPEELEAWRTTWPRPVTAASVACQAIRTKKLVRIADIETAPELSDLSPEARANLRARGSRSVVAVPMRRQNDVVGVISITHRQVDGFSDAHLELLRTFADQAVIAIENVRLFNELQAKNADLTEALEQQTATSEILRVISSSPTDLQPVLDTVVASAARYCGAYDATMLLLDGGSLRLAAHHGPIPIPVGRPIPVVRGTTSGRAVLERRAVHVTDIQTEAEEFPESRAFAKELGYRTQLSVPLLREGAAMGTIVLRRIETNPFTDKQIALLQTFADQAVIAIENVRLFKELEGRNRDLTATSEILRVISSSATDVQPVFDTIVRSAVKLCDGLFSSLYQFDGERIHQVAQHNYTPEALEELHRVFPARLSRALFTGRAILARAVVHIRDREVDPEHQHQSLARAIGWRSGLFVPMLREGVPIGVIEVARSEPGLFLDSEIELLKTFADQAVIAIENVRLFTELQARTAELTQSVEKLTALGEVSQALSSTLDLDTVLTTIVNRAVHLSGADGGQIFEYDEVAEEFQPRASNEVEEVVAATQHARLRKGEGAVGRMAVTREAIQIPDIALEGAYESRARGALLRSGRHALLAVPLLSEEHIVGGLVISRNAAGAFPVEVVELLKTFATQSALAIQNARLFRELADKSRQLEAASQHKSEFLANMSHELRTPLNAIIGFSEVLMQRMFGDLNAKQDEYLKDIYDSGRHLLSLINDILDLSKIEAGRMELELTDFDLPTAIDSALTLVRERATRRGIALQKTLDARVGQVQADERKVRQVVLNLLSNAIKFTPEGGRIEVRAVRADGSVEVSVTDTGVGIAPEDQEAVFEEFRQVGTSAAKQEGTGLGLALCRKFVELHGGTIWVRSAVGAGSTFTFRLPVRP
jgi:GAF domain-containing protein